MLVLKGRAWKFGDNISTDHIVPGRYFHLRGNIKELARHAFEDVNPLFPEKVKENDIVVAGENFGIGSSREHAVLVLKELGVKAVLAKSIARIFFRNAINNGILALTCNTDKIVDGDIVEIDIDKGEVRNLSKNDVLPIKGDIGVLIERWRSGGIINYVLKHKGLRF